MIASKFQGCLLGSLIGDCLGCPFEYSDKVDKNVLGNFLAKILNNECKKVYSYTDDTAMTLSVAKSLIEKKNVCCVDMAKRFTDEYFKDPDRDYGLHVPDVFDALKDSDFKDVFLPASLQFNGSGSYGNGAAMRIAPIALFAHARDEDYIKNAVEQCSFITHTHPNGYNGALLQCLAVHSALKLDPSQKFDPLEYIIQLENKMKKIELKEEKPFCDSLNKIKEIYYKKKETMTAEEIAKLLGNEVTAQKSVPTAIYAFLRGFKSISEFESDNPFMRTIYFAISVGGDADTIACMAGSIAGAYYGKDVIPEEIQKSCEFHSEVLSIANELCSISQENL